MCECDDDSPCRNIDLEEAAISSSLPRKYADRRERAKKYWEKRRQQGKGDDIPPRPHNPDDRRGGGDGGGLGGVCGSLSGLSISGCRGGSSQQGARSRRALTRHKGLKRRAVA